MSTVTRSVIEQLRLNALGTTLNVLEPETPEQREQAQYRVVVNDALLEPGEPTPVFIGREREVIAYLAGARYMRDVANRRILLAKSAIRSHVDSLEAIY